tara:strand:+ start:5536 stop:5805 length:270 start_codon:yes stop_codon:yes gene_type:complete
MIPENQSTLVRIFFEKLDHKGLDGFQEMLRDLYRTVHCYRMYGSLEQFFDINPELLVVRKDIVDLWHELDGLSTEDLAKMSIAILNDIK